MLLWMDVIKKGGQYTLITGPREHPYQYVATHFFYEELAITTRSKDEIRQHIYNKKRSIIGLRDRPQPTPASPPRLGGQSETNSS